MRSAKVERNTGETAIQVQLALDDVSRGRKLQDRTPIF